VPSDDGGCAGERGKGVDDNNGVGRGDF